MEKALNQGYTQIHADESEAFRVRAHGSLAFSGMKGLFIRVYLRVSLIQSL
jgi:hypothetical protein